MFRRRDDAAKKIITATHGMGRFRAMAAILTHFPLCEVERVADSLIASTNPEDLKHYTKIVDLVWPNG